MEQQPEFGHADIFWKQLSVGSKLALKLKLSGGDDDAESQPYRRELVRSTATLLRNDCYVTSDVTPAVTRHRYAPPSQATVTSTLTPTLTRHPYRNTHRNAHTLTPTVTPTDRYTHPHTPPLHPCYTHSHTNV